MDSILWASPTNESFLAEPTQLERNLEVDSEAWEQLTAPPGDNPSHFLSSCTHILRSKLQRILNGCKAKTNPPNRDFCVAVLRAENSLSRTTPVSPVPTLPLALPGPRSARDEPLCAEAFAHRQKLTAEPSCPTNTAAALLYTHTALPYDCLHVRYHLLIK